MTHNSSDDYLYQKLKYIREHLENHVNNHQGVILGTTSVVSRKVHSEESLNTGVISILTDKDAGQYYLSAEEANTVLHIDVLHHDAELNTADIANRINRVIPKYLSVVDRNYDLSVDEKELAALKLASKIHIATAVGQMTVKGTPSKTKIYPDVLVNETCLNRVRVLAYLPPKYLSFAYFIIDETERSILNQGSTLRTVSKIVCSGTPVNVSKETGFKLYLPGFKLKMNPELKNHNLRQVLLTLAMQTGSIEKVEELLQSLSPIKHHKLSKMLDSNPKLEETLSGMEDAKLIKQSMFGYCLTENGHDLEGFLTRHKKELGAQIRKSIKQFKPTSTSYQTIKFSHLKSKEKQFVNRKKVVLPSNPESWTGEVAVTETVIQAAKRTFFEHSSHITIKNNDLRVYGKKAYAPVDMCLLVDCSGSMKGERIQAVSYVTEYLLLNSREKISLVTFQENQAKTLVPFTRNYELLHKSLDLIKPSGLTPLAHGITEVLKLFKKERPRNPLLVLLTDGIPNHPMVSLDPVQDSLDAAKKIAQNKIRFVCIGIDPNRRFLPQLAKAGNGNVYIVDENDRNNMIDIITREKKHYQFS